MMFFILWAVLLLTVVLSVPVVAMVESNRRKKAQQAAQAPPSDGEPSETEEPLAAPEDAVMEFQVDEAAAVSGGGDFGGDDFSAFDDAIDAPKK